MNATWHAVRALAYREILKFYRDRTRVVASFIFPLVFIGVLGTSLQANLGQTAGFNFITFAFTGVVAQLVFQIVAVGLISLNEDREQNLTQAIFVTPISRHLIIISKILGETAVALLQGAAIVLFGLAIGVPLRLSEIAILGLLLPVIAFLGGAFGVFVLSNIRTQRAANQIFPFVLFPQFFLSGVFSPVKVLPWYLLVPSRLMPLTYAVDLVRGVYYRGDAALTARLVLFNPWLDLVVIFGFIALFLFAGAQLFVRNEKNR